MSTWATYNTSFGEQGLDWTSAQGPEEGWNFNCKLCERHGVAFLSRTEYRSKSSEKRKLQFLFKKYFEPHMNDPEHKAKFVLKRLAGE